MNNNKSLFFASFMTLIAAGVGFAIRGGILGDWGAQYGFTKSELGGITGGGLTGFGIIILLSSLIADKVGYKTLMVGAFTLHVLSAVLTLCATLVFDAAGKDATYKCLYWGMFLFAIANGLCETVINPLTAQLFPKQKTHYLNILHAGWPGGLILGALFANFFCGVPDSDRDLRGDCTQEQVPSFRNDRCGFVVRCDAGLAAVARLYPAAGAACDGGLCRTRHR